MSDKPREYDEVDEPILTSESNLRNWIRRRRMARAMEVKAQEVLANVRKFARSPWDEVKPATAEDVIPGAVLWRKVPGGEGKNLGADVHEWFYVERVSDNPEHPAGTFVDHDGKIQHVEGLLAEVGAAERAKQAAQVEKLDLGNTKGSCIGGFKSAFRFMGEQSGYTVFVSESFHNGITKEIQRLNPQYDNEGRLTMVFGTRIVIDDAMENTGFRFEGPTETGEADPNGIKF